MRGRGIGVAWCVLFAFAAVAFAEEPAAEAPAAAELTVANRSVVTFRATQFDVSPQGRAAAARARIERLAERGVFGPVGSKEVEGLVLITVGGEGVFTLPPGDADVLTEETPEALRSTTVANLTEALRALEESRSVPRLMRSAIWSAGATALFLLVVAVIRRVARWIGLRLEPAAEAQARRLGTEEFRVLRPEQIGAVVRRIVAVVKWVGILLIAYGWLAFVLEQFPYTQPWGDRLGVSLAGIAGAILGAVGAAIPGLVLVAVIVLVTRWLQRLLASFFDAVAEGRISSGFVHRDTVPATRRIAAVLLWLFALALAYPYLPGASSAAFQGVTVFFGLMVSLGSTTLVGQVLSGMMIVYSRTFRVGDYVRVADTEGVVTAIGLFSTKVRTNTRELVSVPNAVVLAGRVLNFSMHEDETGVILATSVTIGYGTPWRQVHAMLEAAADRTAGLKKEPRPFVLQTSLADFYVEYRLGAYLERPDTRIPTLAELHAHIQDVFNEYGVQIMSPHYVADPPAPAVVPKDQWFADPASKKSTE